MRAGSLRLVTGYVKLKDITPIRAVNAYFKARQTKREYRRLVEHYDSVVFRPTEVPHLRTNVERLRMLFVGTDEQQDRSGLIQALGRAGDLTLFARSDGAYGHNDWREPEVRRRANGTRLADILDGLEEAGRLPDVVLTQTWATLMDPAALAAARRRGCVVVNIAMDDRHQYRGARIGSGWGGTLGLIGSLDLALTAAPECVSWYQKEGCAALYFPEASDPSIFGPMPGVPKLHDVCFVGACYGIRRDIVTRLRRAGIAVTAYGSGWERGRIAVEEVPRLFAQSKIVLGVGTIGHCRDFYALKLRDFDGPMSGSLYLTHDNADLRGLYEVGQEIAVYGSADDCIDKVRYFLAHDREREAMAAAGRLRAAREHTWDRRVTELLAEMGR